MSSSRNSFIDALSMNGGDGELSYVSNSQRQRDTIIKTQPIVEENIKEMLLQLNFPAYVKVADLGCSSGQNTFFGMLYFVKTIIELYQEKYHNLPDIDFYLNDLPENDFNTLFKLVPSFIEELKGNCFVSGVPGSFYSRLFPKQSLHFIYSSSSIHFLSKVPEGLEDNKNNIYIRRGCSQNVCKSYMKQFQDDFSLFLRMRSEETIPHGRMVLTVMGKKDLDPLFSDGFIFWSLLSDALADLVSEGIVEQSEVDTFNIPFYNPSEEEIREIVQNEGSFFINDLEIFERSFFHSFAIPSTSYITDEDYNQAARKMTKLIRAIVEPMLVAHFGDGTIINSLFDKLAHNIAQQYVSLYGQKTVIIIVSLTKK